ncbi:hypothetical protein PsorP6_007970 [Peronosclerospora sorghi]|uniref:Uncharacterized protein n=1 Tax=Peronosclerospora sorghi TaxID=230839 RepID=A0ACC0WAZ6_9STRA|nr:hypothetical protein PsorP6_007970 [Peronosclerospora sorghi]
MRSEKEAVPSFAGPSLLERVLSREDSLKLFRDFVSTTAYQSLLDTWIECELFRRSCFARENGLVNTSAMKHRRTAQDEWNHLKAIVRAVQHLNVVPSDELNQLRQTCQAEQSTRRLSVARNKEDGEEYPRMTIIVPVQLKLFKAIEAGPFQQFVLQNGFRLLLERICITAGSPALGQHNLKPPVAVQHGSSHVFYPLSLLCRSPELFENAVYYLVLEGESRRNTKQLRYHRLYPHNRKRSSRTRGALEHRELETITTTSDGNDEDEEELNSEEG